MTTEPMKIRMDYAASSETLRTSLKLKGSPVALAFGRAKEDIPPGMPEVEKTIRHCMMVNLARNEGRIFYATDGHAVSFMQLMDAFTGHVMRKPEKGKRALPVTLFLLLQIRPSAKFY